MGIPLSRKVREKGQMAFSDDGPAMNKNILVKAIHHEPAPAQ